MDLSFRREHMADALQRIVGAAERRLTMPILGNVRIRSAGNLGIRLDTTDLELAWTAFCEGQIDESVDSTVSVRKLLDIVRAAPAEAEIRGRVEPDRFVLVFGSSRFTLATLPGADFPEWEVSKVEEWLEVPQSMLRRLIESTMFSMAQQDVRYYLQGLLVSANGALLRTVATDGHRLAVNESDLGGKVGNAHECIVPRKTVQELRRNLLDEEEVEVRLGFGTGQIAFDFGSARLTSKVIDGRFPDYERVIPAELPSTLVVERESLKQALSRMSIVASDKYRGVRLILGDGGCRLITHNAEREEAEDELVAEYQGGDVEIGFNLSYLLEVLNAIAADQVRIGLLDGNSSALVQAEPPDRARYVVMPMRL